MIGKENRNLFDKEYFKNLTDDEKEIYLYNIIAYGIATKEIIDEEEF